MATLKAAEAARDKFAEQLRRLGAHAIEVAQVRRRHKKQYVVIAYFEEPPRRAVPGQLEIGPRSRTSSVEVVVKIAPPFGFG